MSADFDALVEKAARAASVAVVGNESLYAGWVRPMRTALEAVGLPALLERVEAAEREVEHWKAHAEEAGAGFAEVCKTSARVSARNHVLARERDDIFAELNAITAERDALAAKVADAWDTGFVTAHYMDYGYGPFDNKPIPDHLVEQLRFWNPHRPEFDSDPFGDDA